MGTPEISKIYLQSLIDHKYNIVATYTQPPRKQGRGMLMQKSPVHTLSLGTRYSNLSHTGSSIVGEHK